MAVSDVAQKRLAEAQALVDQFNGQNKRYQASCELFDHGGQIGIAVIDNETGTAHACRVAVGEERVPTSSLLEGVIDWFGFKGFTGMVPESQITSQLDLAEIEREFREALKESPAPNQDQSNGLGRQA